MKDGWLQTCNALILIVHVLDSKRIVKIRYNLLNLPRSVTFDGFRNNYTYTAQGTKLRVSSTVPGAPVRDYVANKIYENGSLIQVLFDGGYYDPRVDQYYFYVQDHLGSNRVVVDLDGAVGQRSDFYPYGETIPGNLNAEYQPYLYNGKEKDMTGLDWYDYGARFMSNARWTTPDPLAEKYYSISPYAYCANNPVNRIDPNGLDWYFFNSTTGRYEYKQASEGQHRMVTYSVDKDGNEHYTFHDFADPENDPIDIDQGHIVDFMMVYDDQIMETLNNAGANKLLNKFNIFKLAAKSTGKEFDYTVAATINGKKISTNTLYIVNNPDGTSVAHNNNFGNFLWGATVASMRIALDVGLFGAHANNYLYDLDNNGVNLFKRVGDSQDDQYSIKLGHKWRVNQRNIKK